VKICDSLGWFKCGAVSLRIEPRHSVLFEANQNQDTEACDNVLLKVHTSCVKVLLFIVLRQML
jgi:hypothetical protein